MANKKGYLWRQQIIQIKNLNDVNKSEIVMLVYFSIFNNFFWFLSSSNNGNI